MASYFKKYQWAITLFFIFLGTYFLAKISSTYVGSKIRISKQLSGAKVASLSRPTQSRITFEDYRIILERNIFDSSEVEPKVNETIPEPTEGSIEGPAVKTSLPIKLIGTVSVGDGTDKRSSATISSGKGRGKEETYSIGDEKQFSQGVKLTKILPGRIEFTHNRRLEYAELESFGGGLTTSRAISEIGKAPATPSKSPNDSGIQEVSQGKFVVDRTEINNALGNIDKLFTQIRAVPQFSGGQTTGLKLLSVRRTSLFAKLGLKRGDILERINGQTVDFKKGMELFSQLKDSNRITIDLKRGGKPATLEYEIQ